MNTDLVTKTFNISTQFCTYSAEYVAPVWAQGFECQSGICGLCCLTQLPTGVPQVHNSNVDKAICGFYDAERRLCRKYDRRPSGCRIYPFSFGVVEGQILISASLECPGTNSKESIQQGVILNMFNEPSVLKRITLMNDYYEKAVLFPNIWGRGDQVWKSLTSEVQGYFSNQKCFPFLSEATQLIFETVAGLFDEKAPKIPLISVGSATKSTEGLYIATRFESHNLGLVKSRGSKIKITLFDNNFKEIKKTKLKTPANFLELEMDKEAQRLLSDYVSFLFSRPFLSLAAIIASMEHISIPMILPKVLAGSFMAIEVGATLIACRDNLERIDRDTMREIISFSEGTIHSAFNRPDKLRTY